MKQSLNLLPFEHRCRELIQRKLLGWSILWAACAAAACGLWWFKQCRCRAAWQTQQAAEESYAPLERLLAESRSMREELDWLKVNGIISGQLLEERPALTLIGQVGQSAGDTNGRLVVRDLVFQRREQPIPIHQPKTQGQEKGAEMPEPVDTGPWGVVTLKGEALDSVAVATFVLGLRDSGLFRRVELRSSQEKGPAQKDLRSYHIECEI